MSASFYSHGGRARAVLGLLLLVLSARTARGDAPDGNRSNSQTRQLLVQEVFTLMDTARARASSLSEVLHKTLQSLEPHLCDEGVLTNQAVRPGVLTGPKIELIIHTGECTWGTPKVEIDWTRPELDWDSFEFDFGGCDKPSLEYIVEDAKFVPAGVGPISLEAPVCTLETFFGPPEENTVLQVFDAEFLASIENGHSEMLMKLIAAVAEFRVTVGQWNL